MIKFECRCRHKDGTPIVRDADVVEYAEAVLADYRPELLEVPGKIDGLHFIEKYLRANIDFQDIYYEEDESPIAGATVFNDEGVRVFDREKQCVKEIAVEADTVIIDNSTMSDGKEGFALFTEIHEGGHFLMHPDVYKRDPYQITMYDLGLGLAARGTVLCKRTTMENRKGKLVTQEDFREHQANVFAAAMMMPRKPFYDLATRLIAECELQRDGNCILVEPKKYRTHFDFGRRRIIGEVASAFGASRRAVEIRMRTMGLLMTEDQYANRHNMLIDRAF